MACPTAARALLSAVLNALSPVLSSVPGHTLNVEIFCVSPKISSRARERYRMAATKSDAFVLADTLRHEHQHWRPLTPPHRSWPNYARSPATATAW